MESSYKRHLDTIQNSTVPLMKEHGFRKRGRTFNREREDGIIQVLNYQMGNFPIGKYEIPGIRESVYGKFTINLGILIPCLYQLESSRDKKTPFCQESECEIRERLPHLAYAQDTWFDLTGSTKQQQAETRELISQYAFPWFEEFNSYNDILNYFTNHQILPFCNEGRSMLVSGVMYLNLGKRRRA